MTSSIDKRNVLETLRARLTERLRSLVASQKTAQEGATHTEAKQEHPKDTRSIEQQYLARGLSERAEALRDAVAVLGAVEVRDLEPHDPVQAGALVGLRDEEDRLRTVLLAPAGGGERIDAGSVPVLVVTPQSPLGASLLGAHVGEEIEIDLAGRRHSVVVEWLR